IALMSFAYFSKGVAAGAGTWAVVSDTAPREAVGLAGAIFNCVGNIAGIVTPIVFGYIVAATGSYGVGLYFVGAHCIVAALLFLFVMGKIERVGEQNPTLLRSSRQMCAPDPGQIRTGEAATAAQAYPVTA